MNPLPPDPGERHPVDEPPPFLGSWRRVYIAVLLFLALLITAFRLLQEAFTP